MHNAFTLGKCILHVEPKKHNHRLLVRRLCEQGAANERQLFGPDRGYHDCQNFYRDDA